MLPIPRPATDAKGWDNPDRVRFLLTNGIKVLDSFAQLAGYEADYKREY